MAGTWRFFDESSSGALGGLFITRYLIVRSCQSRFCVTWCFMAADLGNPPTESERLDAWQDPDGREQQQHGHLFPPSPDPVVVPAPPTPESQSPQQPVRNPDNSSSRVSAVRFRDSSGRFLPQSDSHQRAHDESENSPCMRNEPGSSSRDEQQSVDAPDHAVMWKCKVKNSKLEQMTRIPNFNVFQIIPLMKILMLNHSRPSEPRLPHPRRRSTV